MFNTLRFGIPFSTNSTFSRSYLTVFTCLMMLFVTHQQADAQANLVFSQERGFSDAPFNLTITPEDPSVTIRYTLDGEEPSTTFGRIYNGSIPIQTTTVLRAIGYLNGVDTSKVYTHTYLFLDDVIEQPENISGWPNNTYSLGGSGTARHDYEMDPAIVNSSQYRADLMQGLRDIPSMSIVMPQDDFWEIYDGEAERKMSVELLYADDASKNEQEDGGIEPHSHNRLKRSMRLSFKEEYGAKDWDSDIFRNAAVGSESAAKSFDRMVLRGGNNRAWSRNWNEDRTAFTRDEWYRQSQIAASGIGSHGTFVHLYVNGLYWGLYNPVERPDDHFTSEYLGGENEDWFAISHGGSRGGDNSRYNFLVNDVINRNLSSNANYELLKSYLDVDHFSDYLLVTWMTGMTDWPNNNWWGGNRNNPAGPFMHFGWDCEWAWDTSRGSSNGAWVHPDFRRNDTGGRNAALIFNKAKSSDEFMMSFVDRVYKLCFNDGAMTDANSRERWNALNNEIENAVVAESARWGDSLEDGETRTRDEHWRAEVNRLDGLMNGNVQRLMNALRNEGYYPSIDPPLFENNNRAIEVSEVSVSNGYSIDLVNPNSTGDIYYTTNGVDPRQAGGNVDPSAQIFSGNDLVINGSTTLLARVRQGGVWSALHCLNLIGNEDLSPLKITEIMYNPGDLGLVDGDEFEFLEIKNTSTNRSLDLSGLQITDGVDFVFPTGTTMGPQSFIVLAANAQALTEKCPGVNVFGEYEGKLSNGGERIDFATFQGDTIIRVEYDDAAPWDSAADGDGYSLVPIDVNPQGNQDNASLWKLSFNNTCGSPGADDAAEDDCENYSFEAISDFNNLNVAGFVPAYIDNTRGALAVNAAQFPDQFAAATLTFQGQAGTYDFVLSTMAETDGESTYRIAINGSRLSETFTNPVIFGTGTPEYAAFTNTWEAINLSPGDQIRIEFNSASNGLVAEGSGFGFARGRWTGLELICGDAAACDASLIGQACNDGDNCTTGDRYDANCNCVGTFQDSDNDGVCNAEDQCPALDDSLIGRACDDGNPCTTNDVYTSNCACEGTIQSGESTVELSPIDDAYLQGTTRFNNDILRVESGNRVSYLKFNVPSNGTILSAQLELTVSSDAGSGQIIASRGSSNNWTENNLSTSNRPSEAILLGSRNNTFSAGQSYTWVLNTSQISAGQTTLIVRHISGNDVSFQSSEATNASVRPRLILTYASGGGSSNAGSACDDGDPCTINDTVDDNCNCVGVFQDSDNDGICDAEDDCNGSQVGQACNDNDPCTINDRFDSNCNCVGVFQDSDNDGICDAEDDCNGSQVGQACNDNDPCTVNDRFDSNCDCVGVFQDSDSDGICDAEDDCDSSQVGRSCNDNDPCTINDRIDSDCNCVGVFQDSDNDGICDAEDDCDSSQIGQSCNDGDVCTVNDRIDSDCNCVGVFQDSDNDGICDAEDDCDSSQIGQSCNDGDVCTVNDRIDSDCNCVGVFADSDNDGVCDADDLCAGFDDALIGTACNDGDACTTGEMWTSACNCEGGQVVDVDNDGYCAAEDADDNDPCVPDNSDSQCNTNPDIECSVMASTSFENGNMGVWIDGGTSARLLNSASFANTGNSSFYVQGNAGVGSSLYTGELDLQSAVSATIEFNLLPYAVESGDSFVLEVSTGGSYTVYRSFSEGTDFDNQTRKSFRINISDVDFSNATSFRLRSTSNDIADYFIFDDVVIETCVDSSDQGDTGNGGGTTDTACQALSTDGFESGNMGIWIDGGASASILSSASFATTGNYSFYVQGNQGQASSLYSRPQDYSSYESLNIDFSYYAYAVEFNDSFVVEIDNGNGNYAQVASFVFGQDFQNFDRKMASVAVTNLNLSNTVSVRIRSTATDVADYFILDDIVIEGCGQKDANCTPGASCQPSDACYVSGQYDANCNCIGNQIIDADGDGYCAAEDTDDNDPCVPDGSSCGGSSEDCQEISSVGFENGMLGIWNDGGASARLLNSATFSPSGRYCFYVQGNDGSGSSLFSNDLDLSASTALELTFTLFPYSMESGDRFHVEVDNGSGYQTLRTYVSGSDLANETVTTETLTIPGSMLSASTSLRFRAEGNQAADYVMIDDVILEACSSTLVNPNVGIENRSSDAVGDEAIVQEVSTSLDIENVYPNPAQSEMVTVDFVSSTEHEVAVLYVVDTWGKVVKEVSLDVKAGQNVVSFDPSSLSASTYLIYIQAEGLRSSVTKFVKFN